MTETEKQATLKFLCELNGYITELIVDPKDAYYYKARYDDETKQRIYNNILNDTLTEIATMALTELAINKPTTLDEYKQALITKLDSRSKAEQQADIGLYEKSINGDESARAEHNAHLEKGSTYDLISFYIRYDQRHIFEGNKEAKE